MKVIGDICYVMWKLWDYVDDVRVKIAVWWETRGMTTDELIEHIRQMASDGPMDRASYIASELCEKLQRERVAPKEKANG